MEYTIKKLAEIAGISTRTLRYYDEINLLKPSRINSSGYRIYSTREVNLLQQILFYKELEVDLESIKKIITDPNFDELETLKNHRIKLTNKREQLELLIKNVQKTINSKEEGLIMNDLEKFEGFKEKLLKDNDDKYGEEIRNKYGEDTVNKSYDKMKNMTQEEYNKVEEINNEFNKTLHQAFKLKDPSSELAQKAAHLHKQWLSYYWDKYSKEAHAGLAYMYVSDERFKGYYDKEQTGTAEFLKECILIYTGMKE